MASPMPMPPPYPSDPSNPSHSPSYYQQQQQQFQQPLGPGSRAAVSPPNEGVLQYTVLSLNLIRAEIRWIGFIDLVHNLFSFFFLFYYLVKIIWMAANLERDHAYLVGRNAFGFPKYLYFVGNLAAVIIGILLAIPMVIAGFWTASKLRGATNPEKTCSDAVSALHPYICLSVILISYGFACNVALFVIYEYPEAPYGMYLLISNCLRFITFCAVLNYRNRLEQYPTNTNHNVLLVGSQGPPKVATAFQPGYYPTQQYQQQPR